MTGAWPTTAYSVGDAVERWSRRHEKWMPATVWSVSRDSFFLRDANGSIFSWLLRDGIRHADGGLALDFGDGAS